MPPEKRKEKVHNRVLRIMFDVMDTGKEGYNSLEEVQAFYRVIAPEMSETEVMRTRAFELLDTAEDKS